MSQEKIIRIKELTQQYHGGGPALTGINLEIEKGDFVALIGQNGAGKTTLVKHLNGLLRPSSGSIYLYGRDIKDLSIANLSQKVGYVFQNPDHQICMDRVDREVAFGPNNLGLAPTAAAQKAAAAMEKVGIAHLKELSPLSLSKGERQRVALASVLAMEPEVLVLDEPTTGQDFREAMQIMELVASLNQKGHTIVFISHDMQLVAAYARRVIVMGKGKILADGPKKEILSRTGLLAETYLNPPQITELAQSMAHHGIPGDILNVEEMLNFLKSRNNPPAGILAC